MFQSPPASQPVIVSRIATALPGLPACHGLDTANGSCAGSCSELNYRSYVDISFDTLLDPLCPWKLWCFYPTENFECILHSQWFFRASLEGLWRTSSFQRTRSENLWRLPSLPALSRAQKILNVCIDLAAGNHSVTNQLGGAVGI